MKININMNIEGLEKKKVFGSKNPSTLRLYAPLSMTGRKGVVYLTHYHNIARFGVPMFLALFWYYNCENYFKSTYYKLEWNNMETESTYFKLQTFTCHFSEKHTLMA